MLMFALRIADISTILREYKDTRHDNYQICDDLRAGW